MLFIMALGGLTLAVSARRLQGVCVWLSGLYGTLKDKKFLLFLEHLSRFFGSEA